MTQTPSTFFSVPARQPAQLLLDLFKLPSKQAMTPIEVANELRITRRQVELMVADGTLSAVDVSRKSPDDPTSERRHLRIFTESVRRFAEKRKTV